MISLILRPQDIFDGTPCNAVVFRFRDRGGCVAPGATCIIHNSEVCSWRCNIFSASYYGRPADNNQSPAACHEFLADRR